MLLALAICALALAGLPAIAQQPLPVEQVVQQSQLLAKAPQNVAWSPNSQKLLYISNLGALMEVTTQTGAQKVLASSEKMRVFNEAPHSAQDRDRRLQLHELDSTWAPDSKHLLFDSGHQLWFFDPANGTGLELATTSSGSGNNPQFSPDGKYLSYVSNHNLYLLKLRETAVPLKLTDSPGPRVWNGDVDWVYAQELGVRSNYFWSPDSKHLAYLQMDESQVPRYPMEEWSAVHAKLTAEYYPQPGDPNPAVRVGIIGTNGRKPNWIDVPLDRGGYIPRFGWVDSKVLWIETLSRDQKHLTLYFADPASSAIQMVLTKTDSKFLEPSYDLALLPGRILLTGWKDGHEHIYLYRFDPKSPLAGSATLVKQLTSGDWDVSGICGYAAATQTVYYLSNQGDPRQQQLWAINIDGTGKHRITASAGWHETVFSPNGEFFADIASSLRTPPALALCRDETKCRVLWKPPAAGITLPVPVSLELKAADKTTTLYGRLVLPPGAVSRGTAPPHSIPLILNPYGGPEVQTVTDKWNARVLLFDKALAERGFAVLRVDNRGMSGRGRAFAQAAYGDFGQVQFADQMAAAGQVLGSYPQLDPSRVGWFGWGWGGTLTLYAMTHSSRVRAGVAVAPVTDWLGYDSAFTERYLGLPDANRDAYQQASVQSQAAKLNGHLLLVHGTSDSTVHFGNTVEFIQQLVEAGIPYDLQIFPGETHQIGGAKARTDLYSAILAHFERYLANSTPGGIQESKGEQQR